MEESNQIPDDEFIFNLLIAGWSDLSLKTKLAIADLIRGEFDIAFNAMVESLIEDIYNKYLVFPLAEKDRESIFDPKLLAEVRLIRDHVLKVNGNRTVVDGYLNYSSIGGLEAFTFLMHARAILENLPDEPLFWVDIVEMQRGASELWLDPALYSKIIKSHIGVIGEIVSIAQRDFQYHRKALLTITKMSSAESRELMEQLTDRGWLEASLCRQYKRYYTDG